MIARGLIAEGMIVARMNVERLIADERSWSWLAS
jgi:hypothetical protein